MQQSGKITDAMIDVQSLLKSISTNSKIKNTGIIFKKSKLFENKSLNQYGWIYKTKFENPKVEISHLSFEIVLNLREVFNHKNSTYKLKTTKYLNELYIFR